MSIEEVKSVTDQQFQTFVVRQLGINQPIGLSSIPQIIQGQAMQVMANHSMAHGQLEMLETTRLVITEVMARLIQEIVPQERWSAVLGLDEKFRFNFDLDAIQAEVAKIQEIQNEQRRQAASNNH